MTNGATTGFYQSLQDRRDRERESNSSFRSVFLFGTFDELELLSHTARVVKVVTSALQ